MCVCCHEFASPQTQNAASGCACQCVASPKGEALLRGVIPREDFGRMCISRPHVKAWLSWSERGIANLNP